MTEGWPPGTSEDNVMQVIGQYGIVNAVRMVQRGMNPTFHIQMSRPDQAKWLVDNVNRNIPLGLSTPLIVRHHSELDDTLAAVASALSLKGKSAPPQAPWARQGQTGGGLGQSGHGGPMVIAQEAQCAVPSAMGGPQPAVSNKLNVEKLPLNITEDAVRSVFGQYGSIASVTLLGDRGEGSFSAFVVMHEISQAKWLVENLHRNIPVGLQQPIHVSYSQQDEAVGDGYGKAMSQSFSPSPGPYGSQHLSQLPPPPPAPTPAQHHPQLPLPPPPPPPAALGY